MDELEAAGTPPVSELTPAIIRLGDMILAGHSGPGPAVGSVSDLRLTAADGGTFRVRVLHPTQSPRAVVVYFHGGGWVLGDIDLQYDHVARDLVNGAQVTVVLVNYRKAPEHPFPTAIDDAWTALEWVADKASDLAPAGVPLVVAGDSAGGNIAAVLALRARDRNGPRIDHQILIYPVTDCRVDTASYVAEENQLFLDRETMIWFWDQYLPDADARTDPEASPIHAPSLAGLPPALIYLAAYDPLHDDGVAYAQALREAGVPVQLEVAETQMHGFMQMAGILPGYDEGIRLLSDHLTTCAAPSTSIEESLHG
ncbi:alpha/beta hydrolase [Nocardioides panacihumi]